MFAFEYTVARYQSRQTIRMSSKVVTKVKQELPFVCRGVGDATPYFGNVCKRQDRATEEHLPLYIPTASPEMIPIMLCIVEDKKQSGELSTALSLPAMDLRNKRRFLFLPLFPLLMYSTVVKKR